MKNCDFRNAVIGKNETTDPVWPFLNESNGVLKRRNKQVITAQRELFGLTDNGPSFGYLLPSSSQTNDNLPSTLTKENQIESNFPELLKSVFVKTYLNDFSSQKNSNSKFEIKKISNDYTYKRTRTPKYRNKINVSFSSLIKPPVVKKKSHNKKILIKKGILCGNKLDGDRPERRKGKSRIVKKKHLTKHKKAIILSRSLKKKDVYNQSFQKAKCVIPCLLNSLNDSNIYKLERLLGSLSIEEKKNECNTQNISEKENGSKVSTKELAKTLLHSKKFRKYSSNIVTPTLIKNVESLVVRLRSLQDKQHAKDPNKTFSKRRYLCGFRETKRFILCDSVKAIIVATDLEIDSDLPSGGPLNEIKHLAEEKSIPIAFAGKVKQLSYWTMKKQKISIVSILRYEGAEQLYNDFILSWAESKKIYENIIKEIEMHLPKYISSELEVSQDVEQEIRDNIISKLSKEIIDIEKQNK